MKISDRPLLLAVVGALALSLCVAAPARAEDPTFPTGTFTAGPTSQMLTKIPGFRARARVNVAATSLNDDTTVPGKIVTFLDPGKNSDGVGAWSGGGTSKYGPSWSVEYQAAGVYVPKVTVTDADGHSTVVTLAPVTIVQDTTAPKVRVALPSHKVRDTIHGWRTVRGTALDAQMKVWSVTAIVMQRRAGFWFVYNDDRRRWVKGAKSETSTLATIGRQYPVTTRSFPENTWTLAPIRGLTRGLLVIRASAADLGGSTATAPVLRYQLRRP